MDFELLVGIFPQVLLDGITLGFMYALIALGYTMVYGVLEFINFAHSEIFIFGAFVGVEILLSLQSAGWLERLPWVVVLILVLLAGMLASGLLAVTVERVAYRPLRNAPRLIPLISAIGVSFFLQDVIRFFESIWRNAFNLVYPTMDVEPALRAHQHHRRLGEVAGGDRRRPADAVGCTCWSIAPRSAPRSARWPGPGRREPDGRQRQPHDLDDLPDRRGHGWRGRRPVRHPVQPDQPLHRLHPRLRPSPPRCWAASATSRARCSGLGPRTAGGLRGLVLSLLTGGAFGAEYKDIFAFSVLILILIFRPKGLLGEVIRGRA
jgi:branched-chain amino acid transport system permease protein